MTDLPPLHLANYVLWWTPPEKCGLAAVCADCGSHNVRHPAIHACTTSKHLCNAHGWAQVPNNADVNSKLSLNIASEMLSILRITRAEPSRSRQTGGAELEKAVAHFLADDQLTTRRGASLSEFTQYRHLRGRPDDRLRLDVTVSREGKLLAVLELKTTLRSDRGRGAIKNLTSTLTQHSGRDAPIAVIVTAEPLPSRLAAAARKTGETHRVCHVARAALDEAAGTARGNEYAQWRTSGDLIDDFAGLAAHLRSVA